MLNTCDSISTLQEISAPKKKGCPEFFYVPSEALVELDWLCAESAMGLTAVTVRKEPVKLNFVVSSLFF